MRIPPYYRMPDWQRFLAGIVIGILIGFSFFMFLFGMAQERQMNTIREQASQIKTLEEHKKALLEDEEQKNADLQKKLTIQEIDVSIEGRIDKVSKYELRQKVIEELRSLIGNDIESVAVNKELIYKSIEHKPFVIDDITYRFKIQDLVIFSNLQIQLKVAEKKDNKR